MRLHAKLWLLTVLAVFQLAHAQKFSISGRVKDKKDGEDIIGATVFVNELKSGTSTNAYGFYSISLSPGTYTFQFSCLGYGTQTITKEINGNITLDVELGEDKVQLQEVEVTTDRPEDNLRSTQMSVNKLDIKQINKIPALLGEVDVIRSIQYLPGVSSVGEGASGFNVRGGSIDQNLVLLDEAPVYNSSHLFGFFSVFNPDAVKDVKLYKGGIPALYGGRLSSILDVRLKEGNSKRISGQGGVGIIFSRLTLEGPIKKDKGSWIIAARRSYADVLAKPYTNTLPDFRGFKLYFYDLTFKANYTLSPKDKLYASAYFGRDVFGIASFGFNWGNATTSVRWNHLFNNKLFLNTTAFYSNYDYALGAESESASFSFAANIINYSVKPDFTWYLNDKNTINFGGQAILYEFRPGDFVFRSEDVTFSNKIRYQYALEGSGYVSNEQTILPRFKANYGLRISHFNYFGSVKQTYSADRDPTTNYRALEKEDTASTFESVQGYTNPEPRLALTYELDDKSSLKASYMRTVQYLHLLSNTAASIPLDTWTPSTNIIKPQKADQVALGYFRNIGVNNDYETSVEVYYKNFYDQLDFLDGAELRANNQLQGQITSGKGRVYGAEFFVKKNTGKLTGWVSYTLARTERKIDFINNNNWYPTRFDRLHNFNFVVSYTINSRWSINSSWLAQSGTPVNLSTNRFDYGGYAVGHNPGNSRNNYRIPAYYRWDLTATLKNKPRTIPEVQPRNFFKRVRSTYEWDLIFGFYNVLARRNPFAIYPRSDADDPTKTEIVRFSLFGFIIPNLTYNFKF